MNEPVQYKGFYKDSSGTQEIIIVNDFNTLSMEIDGVVFSGSEFNDMRIDDKAKYADTKLERFTFLQIPVFRSDLMLETLCNCSFEIVVPQVIIDKVNNAEFRSGLKIEYYLGNVNSGLKDRIEEEKMILALTIDGTLYSGTGDVFEVAFGRIRDQFNDKYYFKNCYGCQFGDYSVFGQSSFGSMLCFLSQKEQYNKVESKADYLELASPDRCVQEIYCCDNFEIRRKGAGYRG